MPGRNVDNESNGKTYEQRAVNTKREDIFSNASKEIRLTTKNPLEVDNESGDAEKNTRELFEILEYLDKVQKSGSEKSHNITEKEPDANKSEHDAKVSHEFDSDADKTAVFEKKTAKITKAELKEDDNANETSAPDNVNGVENIPNEPEDIPVVNVSVGKFSNVVREQYDEYINFNNREKNNRKYSDDKLRNREQSVTADKKERKRINISLPHFLVRERTDNDRIKNELDNENDVHKVKNKLYKKSTSLYLHIFLLVLLTVVYTVFSLIVRNNANILGFAGDFSPVLYCIINMIIVLLTLIVERETFISGIKGMARLGNQDTAVSVAGIAVLMQLVASLFYGDKFYSSDYAFYSVVLLIIYLFNAVGKLIRNERIRKNYNFLTAPGSKYTVNNFKDKRYKALMLSGVASEKSNIAFQKKIQSTDRFFELSYNNYSGLNLMGKFSLPLAVFSAVAAAIYGISGGGVCAGFTSFAIICCCCVPVSAVFAAELITKKACKSSLKKRAMIAGYAAGREYANSSAVTADIRSIYPKGAFLLTAMKKFDRQNIDSVLLNALSVTKSADSPLCDVFRGILKEFTKIPEADSVIYEDGKGLVGWVNGERILIGSAQLLKDHGIDAPSSDYEKRYTKDGSCITYIAEAGALVAMLAVKYRADLKVAKAMQALEESGIAMLIRTTNENITEEKLARDFGLYHRSIKILPVGLSNVCKEISVESEQPSSAYMLTRGSFLSMAYGLTFCKRLRLSVRLLTFVQAIATVLCIVISAVLVLFGGYAVLTPARLILYGLFWAVISVFLPLFIKN